MNALLLPFATRRSDGQLVSPEEVERGLSCDCTCPGCGHTVMARQGTEKAWHFAHHQAPACADGYEKSVHELAKQLIREQRRLRLPALEVVVSARDAFGFWIEEREMIFNTCIIELDQCKASARLDTVNADIQGYLNQHEILVEITVFHRLMPEKEQRFAATGIACFEIDLSRFKSDQATRDRLESAVFEDETNRRWIFHPECGAAKALADARLSARIEDSQQQYLKQACISEEREAKLRVELAKDRVHEWRSQSNSDEISLKIPAPEIGSLDQAFWRASFPAADRIRSAQERLADRTGTNLAEIERVTGQLSGRAALSRWSPRVLAAEWAAELMLTPDELMVFLHEANFLLA